MAIGKENFGPNTMKTGRFSKGLSPEVLAELQDTAKKTVDGLEDLAAYRTNLGAVTEEYRVKTSKLVMKSLNLSLNSSQEHNLTYTINYITNRGGKITETNQDEIINLLTKPRY